MKVLLFDLDITNRRKLAPNLALMKLSAYHKAKGDEVYLNFPLKKPDIAYASCIFTWNAKGKASVPEGAILGGSGIDLKAELTPEVEHIMPDYSLYPSVAPRWKDASIGFTSRGCPGRCPWCIVREKEGGIKPWARIYEFWDRRHRKMILLDNNLLAAANWRQTMEDLLAEGLRVDLNQGLDIKLVNEEVAGYLSRVNARELRFAFDDIALEGAVRKGIELLLASGIRSRKLSFYVLVGFGDCDTHLERMKILASYNVDVYPMEYRDRGGERPSRTLIGTGETTLFHGSRRNIKRFLRLVGRLPE